MDKKKEGKEGKILTMPNVIFKGFKILRTTSVGQGFSEAVAEHKHSGMPECLCGSRCIASGDLRKSVGLLRKVRFFLKFYKGACWGFARFMQCVCKVVAGRLKSGCSGDHRVSVARAF